MEREIIYEKKGKITKLYLNRPEVKNAINPKLLKDLYENLEEIEKDSSTQIVLLQGKGDIFSSGADLKWMAEGKDFVKDGELLFDLLYKIFTFPKVVIAGVNGSAFGGAMGIIASADFAIAVEEGKFAFSEVRLGIAPAIISPFVLNKVKYGWAKEKFLTGKIFSAKEGLEGGLFERTFPKNSFEEGVEKIIKETLMGGPKAQGEIKKLFLRKKAEEILYLKEELCNLLFKLRSSEEGQEGLHAFFEKRSPLWQKEF